jgi:hypothetical protein
MRSAVTTVKSNENEQQSCFAFRWPGSIPVYTSTQPIVIQVHSVVFLNLFTQIRQSGLSHVTYKLAGNPQHRHHKLGSYRVADILYLLLFQQNTHTHEEGQDRSARIPVCLCVWRMSMSVRSPLAHSCCSFTNYVLCSVPTQKCLFVPAGWGLVRLHGTKTQAREPRRTGTRLPGQQRVKHMKRSHEYAPQC